MKAKTKLIIGIVLAVVILAVGLTVTLVVTGNLERDQQQVVRSASQIETAMSTDLGGKTIVLAEDITVEGDLEMSRLADLDLNGHTLTVTGTFSVESDSAAEIEIKSTDGDKAVSGGTIDAGSVDINVPKAHVEWSADVRLGSDGTFTVLTSGDSFIFTGRFLTSGSNTGTTAAGEAAITALGGRVEIASQTANVEYKVNIPSTASDVRVDSGVPSTSSVEVITSKSVTVSGTVAVTVSEGASGVAITADSGSSLTVTGSAASVNAPSSSVTVAENSTVGSITAGDVTNNGTVSGSITATGDVVNNGSVAGDVTAGGSVTGDGSIGGKVEAGDVTVVEIPTLTSNATYNGAAQTFTVAATDYYDAVTVTGTDADTYTGTLSLSDKVNTKWSDGTTADKTVTLTIAPKSVAVVWSNKSLTYTGSAQAPAATVDTGITGETLALTVTGGQTNAGTYTATASTTNGNYTLTNATTSFTIAKATYDMSDISFTDLTVPYDGEAHTITISGTLPSGVSVSYTTNSYTDVGTYTVTASFTGDSQNYNAIPNKTATLTITSSTATATTAEQLKSYVANANYGTVILGADIAADVEIAENRTIILDLNGHTLTNVSAHTIYNNGTLTVIDSSEAKTGVVDNITHAKAALYNEVGATATLNGGEFTRSKENGSSSTESGGNSYYAILNHGTMTINAGTKVTQNGHYSSLLENGWYDGSENTDETASVLTINGGEFTGGLNTIKNDDWGVLTINDGEFSNMTQSVVLNWNVAEINGGTFTVSEDAEQFAFILNGYINDTMDRGVLTVSADVTFNGSASIFAQMGGSKNAGTITVNSEEHLNAALEVSSVTIILGTDMTVNAVIEKGVTVTLDLNGHTLTSDVEDVATIHNYGTLTIIDTVGGGVITRGTNTTWYVIANDGVMTLDGEFTVENRNAADPSSVINNNVAYGTNVTPAQLTINDGTYYSASSNAVKNDEYGVLTIDGGTFETSIATHVAVQNWATMTIDGGEFTGPGQAVSVMAYEGQTNTTTITGGTFGTPTSVYLRNGYGSSYAKGTINLTITGGTFNGILTTHASDTLLATDKIDLSGFDGEVVIYANSESSLKAAVAIDNASVKLSGDITLTEVLNIDNTVVLNLNDHTIKVEIPNVSVENGAVAIRANEGGKLTINGNGTIDARPPEGEEYANNDYLVAVGAMRNGGYITINEGVTIIVDTPRESCVYVMNGGIVTINGGTFINECTDDYAYGGGAPLTLNVSNSAQVTDIVVYGGTFQGRNPARGDDKLGGNFVADGYKVVERTDGTYEVVAEEAEVTGDDIAAIYYYNNGVASKAEVYTAAGFTNAFGGGYSDILLMSDFSLGETVTVEAGESVTLDFNGKSVTYTGTEGLRPIQNYGTLTVLNTEGNLIAEGQGGMECINATVYGVFDCLAGSTTYIYGGYYETNGSDNAAVLRIREGAEATVYDGSFVCTSYDAAVSSDGKLTIYDGYYYTDSSNRGNWNYCVKSNGEFYMYGGTVIGVQGGIAIFGGSGEIYDCDVTVRDNVYEAAGDTSDRSFYALYVAGEATEVTCLVEGGTFNAHYRYAAYIGNSNAGGDGGLMLDARVQINGGTFIGEMGAIHVDGTLGTAIIRGGSFNTDVNEYVVDGKVCVQNAETEMYDVVSSDYVIETAQDFLDLQQFNSAILAGKSLNVTLANDIDLNDIDMSDAYSSDILVSHFAGTFNGNGHTIKSNGVPYIFGFALNSAEFKNVTIEFNDTEITRLVYRAEYTAIGRSGNTFYVEDDSELVLTYDNVDYAPSSTNEEYYYDFGSVGNSALYYNNNCTLAYAYYDGSDIDTYADSAYYNTDRTTVLPFKITIKNCDVSANFRGAEHGSGAAIFLGGQIYGTYVDIDTCSYSGDFVGEYAGIIFANASGVSGFLDGDGDWNGSFVTGGITYTSNISISDVSLTGTLSTLNGGLTFGNNVTEGVGSSTAESGELTNMTADSSLGISQNESGNYVITGASTDDGTYSYSLRLMMGTVNWYYDADYTNYYGETSNFTITIALDIDETPIELGYSEATPLALSQANEIVASDFSDWNGISEEGYRYAFVESGDSHYVIIDFQGQYGDAYRQFDSDSGTTTAKIYAFDSLDRFVATATEV